MDIETQKSEILANQKSQLKLKNYDPYKKADIKTALNHLKATTVHSGSHYSDPSKICPCCGNNYDVQNYSYCCSPDAFTNYGVSYSSFFRLIKFLMLVLLINFLISGIVTLYKVDSIWECTISNSCEYWLLPQEYHKAKPYTHFFALINIIVIIILKNIYYYQIKKLDFEIDLDVLAPNDFTIFVEGIEKDMENEDIIDYFKNLNGYSFDVIKINRIYRIKKSVKIVEEYMQIEKQKKSLEKKKR